MIHCEEKLLKSINKSIKRYAEEHVDDKSFFRDIDALRDLSLQSVSLSSDLAYFDEINKLFGVFITIITHPYIINERETVILRAEQAYGLTPEMFRETVKNEKLWKDKRGVMTPAEVYYFQNIDELKNYENRFIVHLIDHLEAQLNGYVKYYDFLVGTVSGGGLTQDDSLLDKAYGRLHTLAKKLKRIKETDFYKIVSKANTNFTHIEPTNVFKHNRSYGACYKFYVRNVVYGDPTVRNEDMNSYFFTRLLLALSDAGFRLRGGTANESKDKVVRSMRFDSDEFSVKLEAAPKFSGLRIKLGSKADKTKATDNLLVFDGSMDFSETEEALGKFVQAKATSVDAVNVWGLAYVDDAVKPLRSSGETEVGLCAKYLAEKTETAKGSRRIYENHCPVCGSKDIAANEFCHCEHCGTEYTFVGEKIWLTKLRER